MSSSSRVITKNLAGVEDLLLGIDQVTQVRNGTSYQITRIDLPLVVADQAAMTALDITTVTRARLYASTTSYNDYIYDATATSGIASSGVGFWVRVTVNSTVTTAAPTLLNSWVNLGGTSRAAGYYTDALGNVHLEGTIQSGTAVLDTQLFQLPTVLRPTERLYFVVNSFASAGSLYVDPDGFVYFESGSNVSFNFNGVYFRP